MPPPAPATSTTFPSRRLMTISPIYRLETIGESLNAHYESNYTKLICVFGMFDSWWLFNYLSLGDEEAPMTHIHVIHENAAWLEPLAAALDRQALPWRDWFLDRGVFDLSRPPPEGVFYNRMSASSHTLDHRYAAELTAAVLAWLERHGRRVVNGSRALDLEISKPRQYAALEAAGIRTPDTVLVAGRELLAAAARQRFGGGPFILKPSRGGKGVRSEE